MQSTTDNAGAIFFLVVSAVWFGTSNAAREIVSERAIYVRERMVNLTLFNYLFSKFFLLSFFCVIQCSILLGIVFFTLGFHGDVAAFGIQLGTMIVTAMNSVALGLLISTMVMSSEAAMALTPIALIPQVVLGGLMVPMTTNWLLEYPMYAVPARWGFQGLVATERAAVASDACLDHGSQASRRHQRRRLRLRGEVQVRHRTTGEPGSQWRLGLHPVRVGLATARRSCSG